MNAEIDIEEAAPWLVILITFLGVLLRIFMLDRRGMWLDETFSVWMANHSVADMLQWIVKIDQHPPLYYFLLHYWIAIFGDTSYYVRLMMGFVAAVLLSLSLFNIYYAQETRMYTLLVFNVAIAIYALVRLLTDSRSVRPIGSQFQEYLHAWRTAGPDEPENKEEFSYKGENRYQSGWRAWISRHRWLPLKSIETDLAWVVFIFFSVVTMLTHNTAVLFPVATNIYVLGLMLYQRIKKSGSSPALQAPSFGNWVKAQIGIFLLWSPWLIPFIKQASAIYQRFWIPVPTWDVVIRTIESFLNPSMSYLPANQSMMLKVLYLVVFCLGLVHFRKKFSQFLFLVALFAIPFLGELIVSIRRPIFYDRTLIWTTIPLFLILAAGIAQLKYRYLIIAVVGIFVTINLFSTADYLRFYQKEDWSTAAGYVANFAEKDDLVLFNSNFVEIPFNYYFGTYEKRYRIQVEKQGIPLDLFESGILEPQMMASDIPGLIALLRGHNRVWLVYSHNSYTDPLGLIPQTLASKMELIRQRDFYGGQVQLYETP